MRRTCLSRVITYGTVKVLVYIFSLIASAGFPIQHQRCYSGMRTRMNLATPPSRQTRITVPVSPPAPAFSAPIHVIDLAKAHCFSSSVCANDESASRVY
ncbi:hypothetical protein EI94DRAFT_1745303 [Lactarius quietus]|nr:hypothetical protein EI94DRAFT_1745303 [Lactarius quietus]